MKRDKDKSVLSQDLKIYLVAKINHNIKIIIYKFTISLATLNSWSYQSDIIVQLTRLTIRKIPYKKKIAFSRYTHEMKMLRNVK